MCRPAWAPSKGHRRLFKQGVGPAQNHRNLASNADGQKQNKKTCNKCKNKQAHFSWKLLRTKVTGKQKLLAVSLVRKESALPSSNGCQEA